LEKELQESISERSTVEETRLDLEKILIEKSNLEKQLEDLLDEKKLLEEQLSYEENIRKEKQEEERLRAEKVKQLEDTLLEKTALEHRLGTETEKARGRQDLEKLLAEKEQLEHQLDNTLVDLQAKEKQVAELEDIHMQKIKQLVHDFEKQLAQRDEELTNLEDKEFGKYWRRVIFQ
jgi:hypothetical protein